MSVRIKVLLISVVAMFLGWVEIADATNFAHAITNAPPVRFWLGVGAAVACTLAFPLWRLSRRYEGLWQEVVWGFFGFWVLVTVALLITGASDGLGLMHWLTPVFLTVMLWVMEEADKQEAERMAKRAAEK